MSTTTLQVSPTDISNQKLIPTQGRKITSPGLPSKSSLKSHCPKMIELYMPHSLYNLQSYLECCPLTHTLSHPLIYLTLVLTVLRVSSFIVNLTGPGSRKRGHSVLRNINQFLHLLRLIEPNEPSLEKACQANSPGCKIELII